MVPDTRDTNSYLLLDGHLRIEVLRDLGHTEVECLISTDDEAFTYNKRVSRLSAVQEHRMIAKAIERNVPKDKIARALNINVRSISATDVGVDAREPHLGNSLVACKAGWRYFRDFIPFIPKHGMKGRALIVQR